ncbi:MAG: hypothetical protein GVX78_01575 [Bacteroidetes bacterium]|nr:hypothetical protein [Bacteroidota bacterium]
MKRFIACLEGCVRSSVALLANDNVIDFLKERIEALLEKYETVKYTETSAAAATLLCDLL